MGAKGETLIAGFKSNQVEFAKDPTCAGMPSGWERDVFKKQRGR